ncbi:MAG: outer membrane protein assembly factor BamD [Planctomycetes bacterium]|nr:outer membrane protein assembly factor BamD [Planctomycetota bacterium]
MNPNSGRPRFPRRRIAARFAWIAMLVAQAALPAPLAATWVWTPETGWYDPQRDTPTDPAELLVEADKAFEGKYYEDAARGYWMLLNSHPESPQAAQAQAKLVDAQFLARDFEDALESIELVLGRNPDKETIERILRRKYEIGYAYLTGTKRAFLGLDWSAEGHGVQVLDSILERFPYQPFCDDALFHIGSYYFRDEEYEDAETTYKRLLADYPDSEWAGLAEYQIGVSAHRRVKGVEYDFAAIDESESRLRRYVRRYPGGEKVKEAQELLVKLQSMRGERLYKIAQVYLRERQPKAARIYLQRIVRDFPNEQVARPAIEKLKELNRLIADQKEKERPAGDDRAPARDESAAGGGDGDE